MRRAKHGPALFEVLASQATQASDTLKVPKWWPEGGRLAGARDTRLEPPSAGIRAGEGRVPPRAEADTPLPFVEMDGGRIRISFTSVTAAVAVFLMLAAVLATFELGSRYGFRDGLRVGHEAGRASYAAETMSEIEVARRQPPATELVGSLLEAGPAPILPPSNAATSPPATSPPTSWIRDYTYIVAQEFASGRDDDARQAREFLDKHGISTAVVRLPNGATQLITTQGYNHKDPTQKRMAQQLLEKEHRIGADYYAGGGGYRLKGYFKSLKGDAW